MTFYDYISAFLSGQLFRDVKMWKFIEGVSQPQKKIKLSDDQRKERQKVYDRQHRERCFQDSWKSKHSWLNYDKDKNIMTCNICVKFDTTGPFVTGCNNFRNSTLDAHLFSQGHKYNVLKFDALSKPPGTSVAEQSCQNMNKAAFNKLSHLFRTAHYIAKNGRPYTDYISLCLLDKAKGLEIGDTYTTDRYCQIFINAIANNERSKQDMVINQSPFMSIISDGSTDASSTEAEICYARVSVGCTVSTHFIGLSNVHKADAQTISSSLMSLLDGRFGDTWRKQVIGMGTDGAAVMLGTKGGMVQRIREALDKPFIYAIHCSGHRLELAYKDAVKGLQLHEKCLTLLLNLYLFYKCSPLNRSSLKASYTSLGKQVLIPTRVGGTRWLPHTERAVQHVLTGYDAIKQHLEQMQNPDDPISKKESSAKAKNFLKLLNDKHVLYWYHLLMDVLKCLSAVTLCIQKKDSTLSEVWMELTTAKRILTKYQKSEGPYLRKFLSGDKTAADKVDGLRQRLLSGLVKALDDRFDGDLPLFRDSSFLSITSWPDNLDDFAESEVQSLSEMCTQAISACVDGFDMEAVESEWSRLKTELQHEAPAVRRKHTWSELSSRFQTKYRNLFLLVDFLLTLPASSVDAERGFSKMKIIKNDWRTRLKQDKLTDLMLVDLVSPDITEFDPTASIHLWNTSGSRMRRPYYNDSLQVKNAAKSGDMPEPTQPDEELLAPADFQANEDIQQLCGLVPDGSADNNDDFDEDRENDLIALQNKSYRLLINLMSQSA